jgi:hypothetical protein
MEIDSDLDPGHFQTGRSTRPSGCMTLQIGWLHGGANWHALYACALQFLRETSRECMPDLPGLIARSDGSLRLLRVVFPAAKDELYGPYTR